MTDPFDDEKTQSFVALTRGTKVSHYEIVEKIGAGGMGEVYLAKDTKLKRQIALKFLPLDQCQDEDCRTRFTIEAQATAKLDHPNIVTIHEVSEFNGRPFFAMQYVSGMTLKDYMEKKELSLSQIIDFAISLCEGLSAAHKADIVHRDLKPANILVSESGEPKIVDFGLARVVGSSKLTETGTTLGTWEYMSPEQVRGDTLDQCSDLFSLGVILYELITGKRPFTGDYPQAVQYSIMNDTPEPLARFKSGVSDDLQRVVSKLLEKDPALRYQSAEGVLPDLRQLTSQEHKTVTSGPKSRLRRMLTPAIVVALIIVLVLVLKPWKLEITSDDPAQASIRRLAVLYLANRGAADDEHLSYGITEDLIVDLTRIGTMGVAPMPSILKYKDSNEELDKIAEHLRVNLLLNGSIQKSGDLIRISAQLIDVESGLNLWADRWEETFENLPRIKEALAQGISQALEIDTAVMQAAQVGTPDAGNPLAYDHYLRGKYTFEHKSDDADVEVALGLYRKALELEPSLLAARRGIATVMTLRGEYDKATEELQVALAEARQQNLRSDEAAALRKLAWVHRLQSFYDEAREYAMQALEISRELGDQSGIASSLNRIGITYQRQGDYAKALQSYEQSLEIRTRLDNQGGMAADLLGIGIIYARQGDYAKALQSYEQSLEIATRLGDKRGMAATMNSIGNIYARQGDKVKALQSYEQSLEIMTRLGDQTGMSANMGNIGNIYMYQGDYVKALQNHEQALEIKTRLGDQSGMSIGLLCIGGVYMYQGDYAKALQGFEQSVEISTQIGNKYVSAYGSGSMGELYYFLGDPDSSRKYLEQGLAIAEDIGSGTLQMHASGYLAALTARRGQFDSGVQQLQDLVEEARELGDPEYEVKVERLLGEALTKYGSNEADRLKGRITLQKALSLAEERGIAHEIRWINELLKEDGP